ncbi:MAG: transcriptional regulator, partial [Vibrio fluvialis]
QADMGRIATFRDWMLKKARREQEDLLDDSTLHDTSTH